MHIIRLRSAWESASADELNEFPQRFERSFGKPTNLGGERVFLSIEPAPGGEVRLNGQSLPPTSNAGAGFRSEITALLNTRNLLFIASDSPALSHEVRLEIVE